MALGLLAFGYPAKAQQAGSIAGRVVERATGSPLKNAVVRLRQSQAAPRQSASQIAQQTDENGQFLFLNVPAGEWELSADKRGFVTGTYKASNYDPKGEPLTIKASEQVTDLVLMLVPQAALVGRVLDPEGEPVEGARVSALRVRYSNGVPLWSEAGSAVTLDNGEYRIPRVAAGRYLVKCGITEIDTAGVKTTYAAAFYPNARESSMAAVVDVRPDSGEISGLDIRVGSTPVFHIRGRLQPPDGQRDLGRAFLLAREHPFSTFAERTIDRSDYLFSFDRVPPGAYLLHVQYRDSMAVVAVDVKDHDIDNLLLSPSPGEIRGSLKLKAGGRQVDLRSLSVTVQPQGKHRPGPVRISADLKFAYALLRVDGLLFDVNVSNLPEGCYIESIKYGGNDVAASAAAYVNGALLEITVGSDGATLEGRALDRDEHARQGAVIALIPADGKNATKSTKSGPQGSFRFAGVPPGDYRLLAWDDVGRDDLQNPGFLSAFQNQGTAVSLTPDSATVASIRVITQNALR
jgi:hypothetical protein